MAEAKKLLRPTAASILAALEKQPGFLKDNTHDPLANSSQPLFGSAGRAFTTLAILPLALARIACFIVVFVGTGVAAQFAAFFPRSRVRSAILSFSVGYGVRAGLFFLGYHRVREKGAPAARSTAPVVVLNHVSFVEAFYLTSRLLSCGMAEKGLADIPMVGNVLRAMEFVLVDKADSSSRREAGEEMVRKMKDNDAPRFLAFAEGQTTNNTRVISFKEGAFRLMTPVQPVAISYHKSTYDPCNIDDMVWHFVRATFDWGHGLQVSYLPVITPEPNEEPGAFGERVRRAIAAELQLDTTEHAHEDQRLQRHARRRADGDLAWVFCGAMPEMGRVRQMLGLRLDDCKRAVDEFLDLKEAGGDAFTAVATREKYVATLKLPPAAAGLYDLRPAGQRLAFREVLCATALRPVDGDEVRGAARAT